MKMSENVNECERMCENVKECERMFENVEECERMLREGVRMQWNVVECVRL